MQIVQTDSQEGAEHGGPQDCQKNYWQHARLMSRAWLCKKNETERRLATNVKSCDVTSRNTVHTAAQTGKSTEDDESRTHRNVGASYVTTEANKERVDQNSCNSNNNKQDTEVTEQRVTRAV